MYNSPKALLKGIKSTFSQLFNNAADPVFGFAINRVSSDTDKEDYWIPETLPGIKEWIDERHFGDFRDFNLTIVNKDYDAGLKVFRNTLKDSKKNLGGNIDQWIKMHVNLYKDFPDQLCQIILDDNTACFDGTALFANTRPNIDTGSYAIDNLISGTSSSTYSLAEFEADYLSAKTKLRGFRDKNDQMFNKTSKLVAFVPQHMEDIANKLLAERAQRIYNGTAEVDNLYAGDAKVFVNTEQSTVTNNDWYLINEAAFMKPFIIQDRESVDWKVFDDKKFKFLEYGYDFRMGYGPGSPFGIVKINN